MAVHTAGTWIPVQVRAGERTGVQHAPGPSTAHVLCSAFNSAGESQRVTDTHQPSAAPALRHEIQLEGRTAMAPNLSPVVLSCNSNKNVTAK